MGRVEALVQEMKTDAYTLSAEAPVILKTELFQNSEVYK